MNRRANPESNNNYQYVRGANNLSKILKISTDINFGYNINGITISGTYNITSTTYSWRNQPLSMSKSGSGTFTYRYDHMGHRVYSSNNTTYYLRGAFGETLAVYEYDGQSGIELTHWNIVRPDGTVIGRRESDGTRKYYHRDHLGSTRAVVTSGGSVAEVYDYMPFGDMMDGRITTSSGGANEKFTSHEFDDEVNLYYMQWRRYIPRFGVFTSVDPMADSYHGWSPYNYTLNNPLRFTDPTGMCPEEEFGKRICDFLNQFEVFRAYFARPEDDSDEAIEKVAEQKERAGMFATAMKEGGELVQEMNSNLPGMGVATNVVEGDVWGVALDFAELFPVGRVFKVSKTLSVTFKGFTKHGLNQAINRFSATTLKEILDKGTRTVAQGRFGPQIRIMYNGKGVVIDATKGSRNYGKIITVLE